MPQYTISAEEAEKAVAEKRIQKVVTQTKTVTMRELSEEQESLHNISMEAVEKHNAIVDEMQAIVTETGIKYDVPAKLTFTNTKEKQYAI